MPQTPNDAAIRFSYQVNSIMVVFLLSLLGTVVLIGANLSIKIPDWLIYSAIATEAAVMIWCFKSYMAARAKYRAAKDQVIDPLAARVAALKMKSSLRKGQIR